MLSLPSHGEIVVTDFETRRAAALALLIANDPPISRRGGQFLGQIAVENMSLTPAQLKWFGQLLERGGVDPLGNGGAK